MIVPSGNWSMTPAPLGARLLSLVQVAAALETGKTRNKMDNHPTQNADFL
jgi:hypothetical protein